MAGALGPAGAVISTLSDLGINVTPFFVASMFSPALLCDLRAIFDNPRVDTLIRGTYARSPAYSARHTSAY